MYIRRRQSHQQTRGIDRASKEAPSRQEAIVRSPPCGPSESTNAPRNQGADQDRALDQVHEGERLSTHLFGRMSEEGEVGHRGHVVDAGGGEEDADGHDSEVRGQRNSDQDPPPVAIAPTISRFGEQICFMEARQTAPTVAPRPPTAAR